MGVATSALALTPEQSLLLLTSLPYLGDEHEDQVRRSVKAGLDWDVVLWRAEQFGTLPVLHHHLERLGLGSTLPPHVAAYLTTWSRLAALRAQVLQAELAAIVGIFERYGLPYFVLKGSAIAPLYYPDPFIRHMLDIDIMIRQDDFPIARDLLFGHGYRHGVWLPDNNEMVEVRDPVVDLVTHHEFPALQRQVSVANRLGTGDVPEPWKRKHLKLAISPSTISFVVFVDLHFNLAVGLDVDDVWHDVGRKPILGSSVPVQSPTDMVWFLAARLYNETFQHNAKKLVMLGDLFSILRTEREDIDWSRVLSVCAKYSLGPAVFYVLAHLENLTHVGVPQWVLSRLAPDIGGLGEGNDWGDLMPKLFAIPVVHDLCLSP